MCCERQQVVVHVRVSACTHIISVSAALDSTPQDKHSITFAWLHAALTFGGLTTGAEGAADTAVLKGRREGRRKLEWRAGEQTHPQVLTKRPGD